jgi:hypothetical protein
MDWRRGHFYNVSYNARATYSCTLSESKTELIKLIYGSDASALYTPVIRHVTVRRLHGLSRGTQSSANSESGHTQSAMEQHNPKSSTCVSSSLRLKSRYYL